MRATNAVTVASADLTRILTEQLDSAVTRGGRDVQATVTGVRHVLADFVTRYAGQVPDEFRRSHDDRYSRRLMYRSEDLGYAAIVMTWGPGQHTPIHDHCGMWCVEGVWQGCIEVVQYERMEERGDEFCRFESRGCMQACAGSAGSLIPPHEYHTIANPSSHETAITVHVYRDQMTTCNIFESVCGTSGKDVPDLPGADWYRRLPRQLSLD